MRGSATVRSASSPTSGATRSSARIVTAPSTSPRNWRSSPRFPQGGTFVDIGANVGNHGLYAALFLGAARVIPFEPNPLAYRLLFANVAVNALVDRFVLDHIGVGLSDTEAGGFAMTEREKNLGNARMVAGGGDIAVIRGDTALAGTAPDFIKIDVEGMEMKALGGLRETIGRARPAMLIEVDKTNEADFQTWRARMGYRVAETIKRYVTNRNYLLLPGESGQ